MYPWLKMLLQIILISVIIITTYNFAKVFGLLKLKINKWVILVLALVVFFLPTFLKIGMKWSIISGVQSALFGFLFLWFLDLSGLSPERTGKSIASRKKKIKIKAKPNLKRAERLKNKK